jgi:hypothetical protein
MSNTGTSDEDNGLLLGPRPKRPFELVNSTPPSPSATPPTDSHYFPQAVNIALDGTATPSRTRSILNLTSSTLFGIYNTSGFAADRETEPSTPWGTGAQTPIESPKIPADIPDTILVNGPDGLKRRRRSTAAARRPSLRSQTGFQGYFLPLLGRNLALFAIGVLYGLLISHLHDRQGIAPVKVDGIDRSAWNYLVFWGSAGVLLGQALPYFDTLWMDDDEDIEESDSRLGRRRIGRGMGGWNDVLRSVGAFVGIAFAIRKLPWQSTLQLSLTLALANPALWYLVDRSPPGFILSCLVSLTGTGILLGINPNLVPSPSPKQVLQGHVARHSSLGNGTGNVGVNDDLVLGMFNQETIGVATWIASVLFVSSVCFGNIGRKLAPQRG